MIQAAVFYLQQTCDLKLQPLQANAIWERVTKSLR